jgi:hypothetical protein
MTTAIGGYAGRWLHRFIYRPNTRKQAIERGGTSTSFDLVVQEQDVTTTVETFATSLDSMRDTYRTANLNTATFVDASFQRMDATHVERRVRTISNDIIVVDTIGTDYQLRKGLGASVQVVQVRQYAANLYYGYIIPFGLFIGTGFVVVRRRYTGATALTMAATQAAFFHRQLHRTINNAEFLGYPLKSLMYTGWRCTRNYTHEIAATAHVVEIDHVLRYDSLGHFDDSQIGYGDFFPSTTSLTIGLNAASKFGWTVTEAGLGVFTPLITP